MIAIEAYDADLGMTILYSFLVGIPAAILAGPVFGKFIGKRIRTEPPEELAEQFSSKAERGLPGFGITLFTILAAGHTDAYRFRVLILSIRIYQLHFRVLQIYRP